MYKYAIESNVYVLTEAKKKKLDRLWPEIPDMDGEEWSLYISFIEINGRFIYSLDGRYNY